MFPKYEELSYSARAYLHQIEPEVYEALKKSFERRAASEIRRGIMTRQHRAWLHRETVEAAQQEMTALMATIK